MSYWRWSASALRRAYAEGSVSPVDAMQSILDRATAVNPTINALFEIRAGEALALARESEDRWRAGSPLGVLDGIPVSIKDSVPAKGWPYWRGLAARRGMNADYDSPPVARLRESGALIFAKAAMPDFGLLSSGVSSAHGVTRNPWNLAMNTGGSSSGVAAAVAAGIGPLTIGTDLGGSVRLPAAHCGLFAHKPTQGLVPHLPFSRARVAGPIARNVADAALLLSVISRPDPRSGEPAGPTPPEAPEIDLGKLKIAFMPYIGFGPAVEPAVAAAIAGAAETLSDLGAPIVEIAAPVDFDVSLDITRAFSVRAALERAGLPADRRNDTLDFMVAYCDRAEQVTGMDYVRALEAIDRACAAFAAVAASFDIILSPTQPIAGYSAENVAVDPGNPMFQASFTLLANQLGWPAASVYCGFSPEGLPIGLHILGKPDTDMTVLGVAAAYEEARGAGPGFPDLGNDARGSTGGPGCIQT